MQSIQSGRVLKKGDSVYAVVNQQYPDSATCDLEKGSTESAHAVTEKALDDIEQGPGLAKVYKDTDEMFRDLGV